MEALLRLRKSQEHYHKLVQDYEKLYEQIASSAHPATTYDLHQLNYLGGRVKCASKVLDAEICMMTRCLFDLNRLKVRHLRQGKQASEIAELMEQDFDTVPSFEIFPTELNSWSNT
jgi:hypothetical protein